ncbi:MAG: ATP-binding cassette domain-containing protein [Bacilli bacterium]|nr:ATP-binding cassette domain-containing protein [Bacilli bacterium]
MVDVGFDVKAGSVCGLFGANGAGKSTLLKIISRLELPDSGSVSYDGVDLAEKSFPIVGAMIEEPRFYPGISGYENLRLLARLSGDCEDEDVMRAIKAVGLCPRERETVRSYSLGMKQRLYFAFAIMRRPKILLLDEPFNGIDPIALASFEGLIQEFAANGAIVIISSHEIRELQAIVDKAVFLDHGKLIYENDDAHRIDVFAEFLARVSRSGFVQ